jgi:hypothetical protein
MELAVREELEEARQIWGSVSDRAIIRKHKIRILLLLTAQLYKAMNRLEAILGHRVGYWRASGASSIYKCPSNVGHLKLSIHGAYIII